MDDLIQRGRDLQARVTHAEAEAWIGEAITALADRWTCQSCGAMFPSVGAHRGTAERCSSCVEIERLRSAILEDIELWTYAAPILDAVDRHAGNVRFMELHQPIATLMRAVAAREVEHDHA